MSAKPISVSDLAAGSKQLSSANSNSNAKSTKSQSNDLDEASVDRLEKLYQKHDGDLDSIFKELNTNPGKAKRHVPKSANEFATKYLQGYYSLIDDSADAK